MKAILPETFDLMQKLARHRSVEALARDIKDIAASHGVTGMIVGIVADRPLSPDEQASQVLLGEWPEEWARRYFASNYIADDPTIRHVLRHDTAIDWADIEDHGKPGLVMREATEFGLKQGLTIPQYTLDGLKIGISFSGEHLDRSPHARTTLLTLGAFATARAVEIARTTPSRDEISLTARERECLLWLVEGKTDWEIGMILGISHRTVANHMERLRLKLKATSRAHAAAIAFRFGILR